jgi:hypothetical protein
MLLAVAPSYPFQSINHCVSLLLHGSVTLHRKVLWSRAVTSTPNNKVTESYSAICLLMLFLEYTIQYNGYQVSLPGLNRLGRGVYHPPHLAPTLKKE